MARKARLVIEGAPHHVILRGNNRRRLCSWGDDYWRMLDLIADAGQEHACPVHAFALMANHVHLVVTPTVRAGLSRFVKRFAQRYARYRNARRGTTGKLFEERFKSIPITDDVQLATTIAYIDLNPVRAGLVERAEEHCWSTARVHLGYLPPPDWPPSVWTPSSWYLGLGADGRARADAYADWLGASTAREPAHIGEIRKAESATATHYTRRLERPDRTRAAEPPVGYRRGDLRRDVQRSPMIATP